MSYYFELETSDERRWVVCERCGALIFHDSIWIYEPESRAGGRWVSAQTLHDEFHEGLA